MIHVLAAAARNIKSAAGDKKCRYLKKYVLQQAFYACCIT